MTGDIRGPVRTYRRGLGLGRVTAPGVQSIVLEWRLLVRATSFWWIHMLSTGLEVVVSGRLFDDQRRLGFWWGVSRFRHATLSRAGLRSCALMVGVEDDVSEGGPCR